MPTCRRCGAELPATAKFCPQCAQPIGYSPVSSSSSFPRHLAEKVLTSKAAIEGERKQVTVLFADVRGSMELIADRDPEDSRRILDAVVQLMMDAVHRYEGTVNQVMGDGIMALFGAPLAHEDHAVRACFAALAIQRAIHEHRRDLEQLHSVAVQVRVGLNSGDVVVRSIGNDLRMDYTAVGQTTHLAGRMEQLAGPGTVWITADTARLAEGFITVASHGSVSIKGVPEPIEVFELVGAPTARTRMQAIAARGLTPLVGRQTELDLMGNLLNRAGAGHGQLCAVVGDVGVGKSRLVWEFTHSDRTNGWLILESVSVSYGKATSYRPVVELLRAYFQIEEHDDWRKISEKITGKVVGHGLYAVLPPLLALLDVPVQDPEWVALDPPQRRRRTLDALKRLLLSETQIQPVLVIFEDLQWIDSETQAFLDGLVDSLPTARLLLLVNYRPEYQHTWNGKTYYSQLRLDPLPPHAARDLLDAVLGTSSSLESLKERLITITEGNPFFLEEIVRTLVETRALTGPRGAYDLVDPARVIQTPSTVNAMLAARIDRLAPDSKRLLQCAAVIGKDVSLDLLEAIADTSPDALREGLADLQASEFLYETRLFPDVEYTFKHALTHEVAYGTILQARRRVLHARIVEASERLYKDRLTEKVDRLAQHAVRGEIWDKALVYLRQAGGKAYARSANRESVTYFEQALVALKHLPESRTTVEQGIDIRVDLRGPLTALGEFPRALEFLGEAERLADAVGDEARLGRISGYLTLFMLLVGEHARAVTLGQRALAIADAAGDLGVRIVASICLGDFYFARGDFQRAMEFHGNVRDSLVGDLVRDRFGVNVLPAVSCRVCISWCHTEMGAFDDAITSAHDAVAIADQVRHPYSRIYAHVGVGAAYVYRGHFVEAVPVLEQSVALCQATDIRLLFAYIGACLGMAYAHSGRLTEGVPLLERAVATASALKIGLGHSIVLAFCSQAYLLAGRTGDAAASAAHALDLARANKEPAFETRALWALATAELQRERVAEAEEHYEEALRLGMRLGIRPLVAHCHHGLATLYRRIGKQPAAQEHMAIATTMYGEMRMQYWCDRLQSEMT
jgi:class 3 adenylate cyclase/tetratricopeptide (TPR) repeat protein